MTEPNPSFFVVGTDTDVGKTVASLMLMRFLIRTGHTPYYWKPVQTGCLSPNDAGADASFVLKYCPELQQTAAEATGACFNAPKAPFYAARDEQSSVEVEDLLHKLAYLRKNNTLVVEAAGGLLVPFSRTHMLADMVQLAVQRFGIKPILVARAGLGTINHTLLSIEALHHRGVQPAGIVFVNNKEHRTPQAMLQENMEAISTFSNYSVCGCIPHIEDFSNPPEEAIPLFERIAG